MYVCVCVRARARELSTANRSREFVLLETLRYHVLISNVDARHPLV